MSVVRCFVLLLATWNLCSPLSHAQPRFDRACPEPVEGIRTGLSTKAGAYHRALSTGRCD